MKRSILLGVGFFSISFLFSAVYAEPAVKAVKPDAAKAQPIVQQVCAACHGADGNSAVASNPKLAGQHPEYLYKQLSQFKKSYNPKKPEESRKSAVMNAQVANLSDADMRNLAAFFAGQAPKPGMGKGVELVALGKKIYQGGIASKGVAACMACHSPNGAGMPSQFPRIGGQHAEYTATQLSNFRSGVRANDPNRMMRDIAAKLSDDEIKAVSQYIAGLH